MYFINVVFIHCVAYFVAQICETRPQHDQGAGFNIILFKGKYFRDTQFLEGTNLLQVLRNRLHSDSCFQ